MTKSRGIMPPRVHWTAEQIALLRELYPHQKTEDVAQAVGRKVPAVYHKALSLGLKKTPEYMASEHACRLRRGDNTGAAYRFQPGVAPWNKDMKGLKIGGEATQFKSGHAPHNTRGLGSYRITRDGTLQRKISNDTGSNSKRWRSVHELIWIEANGPVPAGHIVIFKPGTSTAVLEEITLDKIECITYAENMRRNSRHRLPKEISDLMQLRGALNRQINKRSEA